MKKRLLLGLLLSTIFTYISLRGINFEDVATSFKTAHYIYIIPALFILLFVHYLRSYRWGVILSPIEKVDPFSLFSVTCVGFLAIVAIPARIGELARQYQQRRALSVVSIISVFVDSALIENRNHELAINQLK